MCVRRILGSGNISRMVEQPAFLAARTLNAKHAVIIGLVLITVGFLSILCNTVDLTIGTGISAYPPRHSLTTNDKTLSRKSMGVMGHGIWSGVFVSIYICLSNPCTWSWTD